MYRDEEQRDFARKLRNELTDAEKILWHFLRGNKLGVKFRRQAAIGAYVVDFVCFSHQLIIELDGPQHVSEEGKKNDERRTAFLESRGFRVIRFRNQSWMMNLSRSLKKLSASWENKNHAQKNPLPNPPRKGEGTRQGLLK